MDNCVFFLLRVIVWQIGSVPYDSLPKGPIHGVIVISCICCLVYELGRKRLSTKECRDLRFPRDNGGLPDATTRGSKLQWSDQCCCRLSSKRFVEILDNMTRSHPRSGRKLLVLALIWRTKAMGLQVVDAVGGKH